MMNGPNPSTGDKEEEPSSNRTAVIENAFPVAMLYIYLLRWVPTYYLFSALQAYGLSLDFGDCLKDSGRFFTYLASS